jgi:hypothetical protein
MGFTSQLYPGEKIIDDSTHEADLIVPGFSRGLELPERPDYSGVAEPFPDSLLIPESEWEARIKEMEERKTRLSDLVLQAQLPHHDQDGIPYCWIHAPTHCVEVVRVVQNQKLVLLSATSVGCKIKGFRAQGGWGREGLEYISKYGVVPQSMWPENALDRQYDTPAAWEEAKKYIVSEWYVIQPRNFKQQMSALLRRMVTAVGLNYWSHEVSDYDPVWLDGEGAIRFRNSWKGYGDNGFAIRRGSKKYADDAVCPRVLVAA